MCQHTNLEKGPDIHATTEGQLIGEGNKVACRWTFRGTHQGEFFDVPGTANRIEMSGIQIDRFDESGKLVEEWPEYDLLGAMRQMASIPGPYYFRWCVPPQRGASSHFVKGRTRVELSSEREDAEEIPPSTTQNPSLLSGKQRTPGTPARFERGGRRAVRPRRGVLY